jgi:hypothetical protein
LTKEEFAALPTRIRTDGDHKGCVQCTDLVRAYKCRDEGGCDTGGA